MPKWESMGYLIAKDKDGNEIRISVTKHGRTVKLNDCIVHPMNNTDIEGWRSEAQLLWTDMVGPPQFFNLWEMHARDFPKQ